MSASEVHEARDPSTDPSRLEELASSADGHVRRCVAENSSAPVEVLALLAEDPLFTVRKAAAENPSMLVELLTRLAEDPDEWVRWGVAGNLSTPVEVLTRLAADPASDVRKGVAGNLSMPVELLTRLAEDPEYGPRVGVWFLVVTTGGENRWCFHPEIDTVSERERIVSRVLGNMLEENMLDTRAAEDSVLLPFVDAFGGIESYDYDTDNWTAWAVAASVGDEPPSWASDVREAEPVMDPTMWDLVTSVACQNPEGLPYLRALEQDLPENQRPQRAAALMILNDESSSSEAIRTASDPSEDTSSSGLWAAVTGVLAALHPNCPSDVLMRCAVSADMYVRAAVSLAPTLNDEVSAALALSGGAVAYEEHRAAWGLPPLREDSDDRPWQIQGDGASVFVIKVEGDDLKMLLEKNPDFYELIKGNQIEGNQWFNLGQISLSEMDPVVDVYQTLIKVDDVQTF